jgi:hypothetical protein
MKYVKFLVASLFNMTKAELQSFLAPKQDDQLILPPQEEAELFIFCEKF